MRHIFNTYHTSLHYGQTWISIPFWFWPNKGTTSVLSRFWSNLGDLPPLHPLIIIHCPTPFMIFKRPSAYYWVGWMKCNMLKLSSIRKRVDVIGLRLPKRVADNIADLSCPNESGTGPSVQLAAHWRCLVSRIDADSCSKSIISLLLVILISTASYQVCSAEADVLFFSSNSANISTFSKLSSYLFSYSSYICPFLNGSWLSYCAAVNVVLSSIKYRTASMVYSTTLKHVE